MSSVVVPVSKLLQWSPFDHSIWDSVKTPITKEEVADAIKHGRLHGEPWDFSATREQHIERIAYLVVHPDRSAIDVDVGIPSMGLYLGWIVEDGHHRLAAAIYRGDETIEVSLSGSLDYADELLGIKTPRTISERALNAVRVSPWITLKEIAADMGDVPRGSLSARLSQLLKRGLLRAEGSRPRRFALS